MKKILTSALALLLITGAAQAQTKEAKHHRGGAPLHALNLTEEQKSKLKTLHEEERKQMEALRADKSLSAEQSKEKRKQIHARYQDQMSSILSSDQKAQLEKMKAERKEKGEGRGKGKGMKGDRGAQMAKELNLTEAQKQQLQQQREAAKEQMKAIRADQSLSEDQRREKIRALHMEQKQKMQSILTPEQKAKAESFRKEGKGPKPGKK